MVQEVIHAQSLAPGSPGQHCSSSPKSHESWSSVKRKVQVNQWSSSTNPRGKQKQAVFAIIGCPVFVYRVLYMPGILKAVHC